MVKAPKAAASARLRTREKAARTCIVVLGMHRSGTSALTRVLNLLGCDLPKTLIGGNSANVPGHWESEPMARFNDRILESAGSYWNDWLEFNPGWFDSPKRGEFRDGALELIADEFGPSRMFVLKDPRICRLLPFWVEILKEAGVRPLIISSLRNPLEVAASLQQRDAFDPSLGHLLWLRHVLDAENASRGLPRYFTSYDQLISGWAHVAEESATVLNLSWPRLSSRSAAEIESFLSTMHRHHSETAASVQKNATLSEWLRTTFEVLTAWTQSGEREEDLPILDRVRAEFNGAAPAFARLVESGRAWETQARQREIQFIEFEARFAAVAESRLTEQERTVALEARLTAETATVAELRAKLAETKSELARRVEEAEFLCAGRDEHQRKLLELERAVKQKGDLAEERMQALADARAHIEAIERNLTDGAARAQQLADELEAANRAKLDAELELGKLVRESVQLRVRLSAIDKEFEQSRERSSALEQAVATLTAELDLRKHATQAVERKLADSAMRNQQLADQLDAATKAKMSAEQKLAHDSGQSEQLRNRLSELDEELERALGRSAALEQSVSALTTDLEVRERAAMEREAALAELKSRLAQTESALIQRRHEADQTALELSKMRNEHALAVQLRQEIDKVNAGLREHVATLISDLKERAAASEAARTAVQEERNSFEQALAGLSAELDRLRRDLSDAHDRAARDRQSFERNLAQRFAEVAKLTVMLRDIQQPGDGKGTPRLTSLDAEGHPGGGGPATRQPRGLADRLFQRFLISREIRRLKRSGIFDSEWYLSYYHDVAEAGVDPYLHFVVHGLTEGRAPNAALAKKK